MTRSVSSSRCAVGSSSSTHGPVRDQHPGQREPRPLAGRQAGAVLAERRVEPVGEVAHDARRAPPGAAPPTPRRRRRPGRPSRRLSRDGAGHEATGAAAATPPGAPPGRVDVGQAVPPTPDVARRTAPARRQHRQQGRLAAAGRPGDRGQAAVGEVERRAPGQGGAGVRADRRDRAARAGRRWAAPAGLGRSGPRQQLVGRREGGGALGGGVELRADPAQRPVGLGGEQQHDQRGPEVEVPRPAAGRRSPRPARPTGWRPARARPRRRRRAGACPGSRGGSDR